MNNATRFVLVSRDSGSYLGRNTRGVESPQPFAFASVYDVESEALADAVTHGYAVEPLATAQARETARRSTARRSLRLA